MLIDISQPLAEGMTVWPGDTEYQPSWTTTLEDSGVVNVGAVTMSLHTGTHADAPKHFRADGLSPDGVDLAAYIGEALVLDLSPLGGSLHEGITAEILRTALGDQRPERLLCKTVTVVPGGFPEWFAHFTADGAKFLAEHGVRLIGIDTPSVDRVDSKELGAHHVLADAGIAILENLALAHVTAGRYELIALPLKLVGMDASPVRAVLRTL